jgi:hypothetical protein
VSADELAWGDGLDSVTSGLQSVEMSIVRHDEIRLRRNCAIAELVVIWVGGDDGKTELRLNPPDVAVKLVEQVQLRFDLAPPVGAGKPHRDFRVFEQDVVGNRQRKPAIEQCAEDLMMRLPSPEDLEKDVGIEADRHA